MSVAPPGQTRPTLVADGVIKSFGGLTAVAGFDLALPVGGLVGLIGPNGAGKTTVFNLMTGVYAPTAGTVSLGGRRLDGLDPARIARAGVARTFQNIRLFAGLSVLDNVTAALAQPAGRGLWATLLRTPAYARRRREAEAEGLRLLATLNLADKADLPAASLPYGDQRRLEIARALATRPKILLLDEPAAGMNPQEKIVLMDLIRSVRDAFGVGILVIEHDMKLVMGICERVTVLDHGETIAVGTPGEVQNDPTVIAAYLGDDDG